MSNIKVLGDLELAGSLGFSKNYIDFPQNPQPRTIVVKEGVPYIYTELVNGSGFFTWQPMGIKQASHLHTQGVASVSWTITHNFNTTDFAYFVYDSNHRLVVANIEIIDLNTVRIVLSEAMTGTVVLFSMQYLNSTTLAASKELTIGTLTCTDQNGILNINNNPVAMEQSVTDALALVYHKTEVDSLIATEVAARQAADSALGARIDNILTNTDATALNSLSELVSAFQGADGSLATSISDMAASAASALGAEVTRATGVEATLATEIATKANSVDLADVALSGSYADLKFKPALFSGNYADLNGKPTIPSVPTNVSSFNNDAGYATVSQLSTAVLNKVDGSTLATVATTGNYADLTGKPVLPTVISAFTNDSGYLVASNIVSKLTANTAITAGTGTKITYDTKGLVTSSTSLSASDVPSLDWTKIATGKPTTLAGYGITDAVSTSGAAGSAAKLATARSIAMTGDVTWTISSFDGSANVTATSTLANSGVTAGTYNSVTVDAKGRVTVGTNVLDKVRVVQVSAVSTTDVVMVGSYFDTFMTIDGVTIYATWNDTGDAPYVLLTAQGAGNAIPNGLYQFVGTGSRQYNLSRAVFVPVSTTVTDNYLIFSLAGTANASELYLIKTSTPNTPTKLSMTIGTGLVKSSSGVVSLATSGVTAGTYKSVTVDAKGRVTAGTNPTTLSGYGITDAQPLDGDLISIAGLTGTSGILKKTAANTWTLDTTVYQTASDVNTAIQAVVGAAPAALDTLQEIAAQLASDESAVSALTTTVAGKATITYVDNAIANLSGGLTASVSDLATEIADRTAADITLQGNIDAEALVRSSVDTLLQADISTKANSADVYTKAEVDAAIATAIAAFAATLYV